MLGGLGLNFDHRWLVPGGWLKARKQSTTSLALLCDVGELMSKQKPTRGSLGRVLAVTEHNVATHRVRERIDRASGFGCEAALVNTH